ncbi:MAG: hypothetical protein OXU51_00580 [Candidatus Poribacteria bacterium]|nr:hypothetical protein [Candidatus Poribacteria bacterium]
MSVSKENFCFVGRLNSFDKTPEGKPQKLRVKTRWRKGENGQGSGNVGQLRRVQLRDGYAYET